MLKNITITLKPFIYKKKITIIDFWKYLRLIEKGRGNKNGRNSDLIINKYFEEILVNCKYI